MRLLNRPLRKQNVLPLPNRFLLWRFAYNQKNTYLYSLILIWEQHVFFLFRFHLNVVCPRADLEKCVGVQKCLMFAILIYFSTFFISFFLNQFIFFQHIFYKGCTCTTCNPLNSRLDNTYIVLQKITEEGVYSINSRSLYRKSTLSSMMLLCLTYFLDSLDIL